MDKKRKINIYKGCRRDIKINSDIYLVRNVKERSSDEEYIDKASSADIIIEKSNDSSQIRKAVTKTTSTTELSICINDEPVKKNKTDNKKGLERKEESNTRAEPTFSNNKVFVNLKKKPQNEILIEDASFEEFKANELCCTTIQTQNERDALDSSSLFSLSEKRILRINSYTPVLVDTLLLEKLVRLDKTIARRLIFKVFKQLDEVILPSEEITKAPHYADGTAEDNQEAEFAAIIKCKEKKTQRKVSIKKFLTNQIYHLLHSRLVRNKERPAEVLYYLILKSAFKKNPVEAESNADLKRVKEKIKEYTDERYEKLKKKKAKHRKKCALKISEDDITLKKMKKTTKKKLKKNKTPEEIETFKRSESVLRNNRRNALADKLLKVHKGIVVDKDKQEKTIKEYLTKQGQMMPAIVSDAPETSSSDLS